MNLNRFLILCLPIPFLFGCVSASKYQALEQRNGEIQKKMELYQKAEAGKLVEEYEGLQKTLAYVTKNSTLANTALKYLTREGWEIVVIEGTVRITRNEYDLGTEYLIVHNVGILDRTVLYEAGLMSSFLMINAGPAVAKESLMGIDIIDNYGWVQHFSERSIY